MYGSCSLVQGHAGASLALLQQGSLHAACAVPVDALACRQSAVVPCSSYMAGAHSLYIASGSITSSRTQALAAGAGGAQRSAAARAAQLAAVAAAAYEAGGPAIHLPLDASHALIVVMQKARQRTWA